MSMKLFYAVTLLLGSPYASATVLDRTVTVAGMPVHYKVVLPNGFESAKTYPAVLAFPPGNQDMNMVLTTLVQNWSLEAQKRGYIVVIPAAPNGRSFRGDGAKVFPEFLDKLLGDYKIRAGKFHIAGMSAGGMSAFHLAASYPQYFLSLIGFPGYLPDATPERMKGLAGLCIYMHVGEFDDGWVGTMQQQAAEMKAKGYSVKLTVETGEQHVIRALTGSRAFRLFEELEACAK